ncbi:MAG: DUF998 domain-containing protein [Candidatus Helarchaeota archaeon]
MALLVFLISGIFYTGSFGEHYSILNHFISELGEWGVSELAIVFNIGLIIVGFIYIPFLNGLGNYIKNKIAKIAKIAGLFSAIALIFVGIFAMNLLVPHYIAAMSFFYGGIVTVGLMTVSIQIQDEPRIPKAFSIAGIIVVLTFALFLFFPMEFNFILIGGILGFMRPSIVILAVFEWAVAFAIIGFLLLISVYLHFNTS